MKYLRHELSQLDNSGNLNLRTLEQLKSKYGHSIAFLGSLNCNCVMYALCLTDNKLHDKIARSGIQRKNTIECRSDDNPLDIFADTLFVDYCLQNDYLKEIPGSEPGSGDIVIYSCSGSCRHIGKLLSEEKIISKWGVGNLYKHGLNEVPASYGDEHTYTKPIAEHEAINYFVEYSKSIVVDDHKENLNTLIDQFKE